MSVNKSYIESIELSTGTELVIQSNGQRVSLSIDGPEVNISYWITKEEAQAYADMINKLLEEIN